MVKQRVYGPPMGDKRRQRILDHTDSHIIKNLPEYIELLEKLARGVVMIKKDGRKGDDDESAETIYWVAPDRQALQFLIDHGIGKSQQKLEIGGSDKPIGIVPVLTGKTMAQLSEGTNNEEEEDGSDSE